LSRMQSKRRSTRPSPSVERDAICYWSS
jgi:hypothetical protein